jgi:amino acid transporter
MIELVVSVVLMILAVLVFFGKADFVFRCSYGPGYRDGKFVWWKQRSYKLPRDRYIVAAILFVVAAVLLCMYVCGVPEFA